ncbi:MAG: response regulator [bacterium]|nr:response regulator [bacterium]
MARILIAEDDPMVRRTITKGLAPLQHDLLFVSDGIHAMDILRCNPCFDLLITDISMPLLDGRQLVSTIAHDKSLCDLPVLIMSGVVGVNEISDLLGWAGLLGRGRPAAAGSGPLPTRKRLARGRFRPIVRRWPRADARRRTPRGKSRHVDPTPRAVRRPRCPGRLAPRA